MPGSLETTIIKKHGEFTFLRKIGFPKFCDLCSKKEYLGNFGNKNVLALLRVIIILFLLE
jgi:hypothetical protein